jgi:hypothetical protein
MVGRDVRQSDANRPWKTVVIRQAAHLLDLQPLAFSLAVK